jgi:hypothetical protein
MERRGASTERLACTLDAMSHSLAPEAKEPSMQHDGSNSARARSARIRAAHDYEATRLESMRRNTGMQQQPHVALMARLTSVIGRVRRWNADPSLRLEVDTQSELVIDPRPNE